MLPVIDMLMLMMMTIWLTCSLEKRINRLITLELPEDKVFKIRLIQGSARVIFFNLETRMRVSPIQSCTSRRDREFLKLDLRLRDETKKKSPPISCIETRSRFINFILRLWDKNENSLDVISVFETRTRILKVAIFPWIQAWTASLFWVTNSVTI